MPQADYTVSASQSGSAYASDINDALLAIQTNNSGTTAPTDLEAFMAWADTTTNFLKTRDAGNTTWYTQFPLNKSLSAYVSELILVYGLGGTAPLKSGDDLNSVDQTGLYRITTGTANNTYGNGSVLVVNRGSGVVDQLILSVTDSKLYLRNTANNGSLWTLKATIGDTPTLNSLLPSQTSKAGQFLKTDATDASWSFPYQASVAWDQTTTANLTGTYTRTGTLITATVTAHGMRTGHRIMAQHDTGGALNGDYTITVVDANTFTYNTVATGAIATSNLTLPRQAIKTSATNFNVSFVADNINTGISIINFTTPMVDANYKVHYTVNRSTGIKGWANEHMKDSISQTPNVDFMYVQNYDVGYTGGVDYYNCQLTVF